MSEESPSNSVLEIKLDYIQKDIATIKSDVKEIKSDFISRREHETSMKDTDAKNVARFTINEKDISRLNRFVYWIIFTVGSAFAVALLKLVIK